MNHAINDKAEAPEPKPEKPAAKKKAKPAAKPKAEPKPEPAVKPKDIEDYTLGEVAEITSAEGAEGLVGFLLQMASEFAENPDQLKDFYRKNKATIDVLDRDWNEQYEKLRVGFSELKNKLSTTEEVK